jgi:hypothetical protein
MGRARGNDPVQNDYVGAFKSMGQKRRRRINRHRNQHPGGRNRGSYWREANGATVSDIL